MPAARTEVTEIVTGLAMLGFPTVRDALEARPAELHNVEASHWDRLGEVFADGSLDTTRFRPISASITFISCRASTCRASL